MSRMARHETEKKRNEVATQSDVVADASQYTINIRDPTN